MRNITFPKIFVQKWVDYTSKYGLGYLMSNQTVGVYFNDNSKMISHIKTNEYISYYPQVVEGEKAIVEKLNLENFPEKLKKKITLFKHFNKFFKSRKTRAAKVRDSELDAGFLSEEIKLLDIRTEVEINPQ